MIGAYNHIYKQRPNFLQNCIDASNKSILTDFLAVEPTFHWGRNLPIFTVQSLEIAVVGVS